MRDKEGFDTSEGPLRQAELCYPKGRGVGKRFDHGAVWGRPVNELFLESGLPRAGNSLADPRSQREACSSQPSPEDLGSVQRTTRSLSLQRSFPQVLSENARGQGRGAEGQGLVLERTELR